MDRNSFRTTSIKTGLALLMVYMAIGALLSVGWSRRAIYDEYRYFAYLPSILIDGDLDIVNNIDLGDLGSYDWDRLAFQRTLTGAGDNKFSIGPAILWSPAFLLTHGIMLGLNELGGAFPADGISIPYKVATVLEIQVLGFLGVLCLYWLVRRQWGRTAALFASLALLLASFWPYYIFASPLMSHGIDITVSITFLAAWITYRSHRDYGWLSLTALASAILVLVRWQNAIVVSSAIVVEGLDFMALARRGERKRLRTRVWQIVAWVCLALAGTTPQIVTWVFEQGAPLAVPQSADFLHWADPKLLSLLFSSWHGLATTHPVVMLGWGALLIADKRDSPFKRVLLLSLPAMALLNGAVDDWWAGASFGMRRFDSLLPFAGLGLGHLWCWARSRTNRGLLLALTSLLGVMNLTLASLYAGGRLHAGMPLAQQIGAVLESSGLAGPDSSSPLASSSPLGLLLTSLKQTALNRNVIISWGLQGATAVFACAFLLVFLRHRGSMTKRVLSIAPLLTPLLAVLASTGVFLSAVRTDFSQTARLELIRVEMLSGNQQAVAAGLTASASHDCESLFAELESRSALSIVSSSVASKVVGACGPTGWMRVAELAGADAGAVRSKAAELLASYAVWHPNGSGILHALGELERQWGNQQEAERLFRLALDLAPGDSEVVFALADLLRARGMPEEATRLYLSVPGYLRSYGLATTAQILGFQGDADLALSFLERAAGISSGDPLERLHIAAMARSLGQRQVDESQLKEALSTRPQMTLGNWYPQIGIGQGQAWLALSNLGDASLVEETCRVAGQAFGYSTEKYERYLMVARARAHYAVAWHSAREAGSTHAEEELRAAIAILEKMLDAAILDDAARIGAARTMMSEGSVPGAFSVLLPLTRYYHPRTAEDPLPDLGELLSEAESTVRNNAQSVGSLQTQLAILDSALATSASSADNERGVSAALRELRSILGDLETYDYWWTPKAATEAYLGLATALKCAGRESDAALVLERARQLYPRDAQVWIALGDTHAVSTPASAAAEYERALILEPGDYWAHLAQARFLLAQGYPLKAADGYLAAISLSPGYAIGYSELAGSLEEARQDELARIVRAVGASIEPGWVTLFATARPAATISGLSPSDATSCATCSILDRLTANLDAAGG